MTPTERLDTLQAHIQSECHALNCRMLFVTYFDHNSSPSIAISQGISHRIQNQLSKAAWYEMDKACNYMEPIRLDQPNPTAYPSNHE